MMKFEKENFKDLQPSKELKDALFHANVPKTTTRNIAKSQEKHIDLVINVADTKLDIRESKTLPPQLQNWFLSKAKELTKLVCNKKDTVKKTEYLKQEIKEMGGLLKDWHSELKLGHDYICKMTALEECYIDKNNKLRMKNEDNLSKEKIEDFFDTFTRIVKNTEETIYSLDTTNSEEDFVIKTLLLKKIRLLKGALNREETQLSWTIDKSKYFKKIVGFMKEVAQIAPISEDYLTKTEFLKRLEKLENVEFVK